MSDAAWFKQFTEDAAAFADFAIRHTHPDRASARTYAETYLLLLHHPFVTKYMKAEPLGPVETSGSEQ